ncbi:unnamed protein product, partial [Nesidiocoris tenuis]
ATQLNPPRGGRLQTAETFDNRILLGWRLEPSMGGSGNRVSDWLSGHIQSPSVTDPPGGLSAARHARWWQTGAAPQTRRSDWCRVDHLIRT